MTANERKVVAQREQLLLDGADQSLVVAIRKVGPPYRAAKQDVTDDRKSHGRAHEHDVSWRVAWTVEDAQNMFPHLDLVAFLKPPIRQDVTRAH
jgi:hypothetical protein